MGYLVINKKGGVEKVLLNVLVVDDEQESRDLLNVYLQKNKGIRSVEEADSVESALYKYFEFNPDVVFVDMVMPGRDGASLIELLKKRDEDCNVVIVSADKDCALSAIQNNVYDFLLKPVRQQEVEKIIEKYKLKKRTRIDLKFNRLLDQYQENVKIRISSSSSHILVDPEHILYCEAMGSYTVFYMDNGSRELVNTNLGKIAEVLSADQFYRISRSYLINRAKLSQVNRNDSTCTLVGENWKVSLVGTQKQIRILCEMDF